MAYFATLVHFRVDTILLKNMPRWRADTIRPYADGATESAGQKFSVQPAGIARPLAAPPGSHQLILCAGRVGTRLFLHKKAPL